MLCEVISQDITAQDYPIPYPFTGSSRKEDTDISEILDWPVQVFSYQSLQPLSEIDLSSVHPKFEVVSETYATENLTEENIIDEMLEYDIIVRMPPRRMYTVTLEIMSIKKAEPRVVEPDWI